LWRRLEWVAKAVKAEDPNHPVGTVLTGLHEKKAGNIAKWCPSIEFLGINAYGDYSLEIPKLIQDVGWTKPYAITEFGPSGHWASPRTTWGTYVEESSSEKVPRYNATFWACENDPRCVGSFAFVWGWKWEKTGTWYGMFNEWEDVTSTTLANCTGCPSEVVATMHNCWTGDEDAHPSPSIEAVSVNGIRLPTMAFTIDTDAAVRLHVHARHPGSKSLTAVWAVTEEIVSDVVGGAFEATNPLLRNLWPSSTLDMGLGLDVVLNATKFKRAHAYRLYVFAREDPAECPPEGCARHEAVASLPFYTCHTAVIGEECYQRVMYARQEGIKANPEAYPGVNESSDFEDFQMMFYQMKLGSCHMPCGQRYVMDWSTDICTDCGSPAFCHTATKGEECHWHVQALMEDVRVNPGANAGLTVNSSFEAFQQFVHERWGGICVKPCAPIAFDANEASLDEGTTSLPSADAQVAGGPGLRVALAVWACVGLRLIAGIP
jgi:hypothetical protein